MNYFNIHHYSLESFRISTNENNHVPNAKELAKAGFYYENNNIKCFACNLNYINDENIMNYHRENQPNCPFVKDFDKYDKKPRRKIFHSCKNLYYEKERRDTFVEWPLLGSKDHSPDDLAKRGFYFTRENKNCICIFCFILLDDNNRYHHSCQDHIHNVSIEESNILDKLVYKDEEPPIIKYNDAQTNYKFCTLKNRLNSFKSYWPKERVNQTPQKLARAGFYYGRVGDGVICYSCGGGLRNWELNDDPWELHQYWYPHCPFVNCINDADFNFDGHRHHHRRNDGRNKISSGKFKTILDDDLNQLYRLSRLPKQYFNMSYGPAKDFKPYYEENLKIALRMKLKQTGIPFFTFDEWNKIAFNLSDKQILLRGKDNYNYHHDYDKIMNAKKQHDNILLNSNKILKLEEYPLGLLPTQMKFAMDKSFCLSPTSVILAEYDDINKDDDDDDDDDYYEIKTKKQKLDKVCSLCYYKYKETIVFIPCHHACICRNCSVKLTTCPFCRKDINSFLLAKTSSSFEIGSK